MGLRSWILGFDPEDIKALKEKILFLEGEVRNLAQGYQDLLKQLLEIQRALESKADKKSVERELESLSKLVMAIYDKLKDLEAYSEYSTVEKLESKDKDILVLNLLRQGYTSPSEILSRLEISSRELYEVLKRLEEKKKIRKFRKGRKVHYYIIEEV
ncbi:hypothetical protein DRN43_02405 [Thermococci archaeon]|nr:MAG: hypothetical protein DRN41_01915 [Thermococci archaeon]RLF90119.1 MAG: hypothetical protein DRN43_02405 [Thermococci archaeon]